LHRRFAQQSWVVSPHAVHKGSPPAALGATHTVFAPPHALPTSWPGQHFLPSVPQVAQAPVAQKPPPSAQVPPFGAQVLPEQHPPPEHCWSAQQGWLSRPQLRQFPVAPQTKPESQ
jgi:hypothetical protein